MNNNNNAELNIISRDELKPYADSEKLGYIYITGTINTSQKDVFKDRLLCTRVTVCVRELMWADQNRYPRVIKKTIGTLDHAYIPTHLCKSLAIDNRIIDQNVQIVSYKRHDGTISYGFDELKGSKATYGELLRVLDIALKMKMKMNQDFLKKITEILLESCKRLKIDYELKGGSGLISVAAAEVDNDIVNAYLFVAIELATKCKYKIPKKSKGFGKAEKLFNPLK